jgi:polyisoprenoid-binding protein YceI
MHVLLLTAVLLAADAETAVAASEYMIDPAASQIRVHVGKSGLFKFAGHEHEVVAAPARGRVRADPADLAASSVEVHFDARDLRVSAEKDGDDTPKVQEHMETEVLEIAKHASISFISERVSGQEQGPGRWALEIVGRLLLHGVSREIEVPVEVTLDGPVLTARGRLTITHDAFGMKRISAGGGTVKVANDIAIDFTLAARAQ